MKKLLLTLVVAAVAAGSAMAQNYDKNIFGVRAGLNVSNVSMDYFAPKSKAGFHVAGVYQRPSDRVTAPLFGDGFANHAERVQVQL